MVYSEQFEYKVVRPSWRLKASELDEKLNNLGSDGWELIAVVPFKWKGPDIHYFKRKKN